MLRKSTSHRTVRKRESGFTLVELMIIVTIVGVLSAVALPSMQEFIKRSRESEAPNNIMAMAQGAKIFYNEEKIDNKGVVQPPYFPVSSTSNNLVSGYATLPKKAPCKENVGAPRYNKNSARWHADRIKDPWYDLKFSLPTSHYFQYGYRSQSAGRFATYTVRAMADLDCSNSIKIFMYQAHIDRNSGEIINGIIMSTTSSSSSSSSSNNNNNNSSGSGRNGPGPGGPPLGGPGPIPQ